MNEEILRSIYGELYNAGLTSSDINTWANNFVNDKGVRENIHGWLTENEYTSNDYSTWETNVLGEPLEQPVVDDPSDQVINQLNQSQTPSGNLTKEEVAEENKPEEIELPEDGGFFEDLWLSAQQGYATGGSVGEAFDVYRQGASISDEDLDAYITAAEEINALGPSREQVEFQKAQAEEGGGIWGTLKAIAQNPGFVPQFLTTSAVTMATSLAAPETAVSTATGAVGGAGIGAVAGLAGGPLAPATSTAGAVTGGLAGATAGLVGAMETGLTLTDLLKEELGGKEFNKENIRAILEDEDAIDRIKSASLARGLTIGAVEGLTMGLSRGVGGSIARLGKAGGKKTAAKVAVATTGVETTGGFVGEVAGQAAAGQEIDLGEATLEAIGELKGVANVSDVLYKSLKGQTPKYKVNGETVSRKTVEDIVNNKNTSPEDLAKINIQVENDINLNSFVQSKQSDAILETQIDAKVSDVNDRKALVELEKNRAKAEADTKKKGIFAVPDADVKLKNVETQISDIITKYAKVDGRTKDVRARKKSAKAVKEIVADKVFEGNLEFAKKHSSLYGLEVDDSLTVDQIKEQYGEEAAASDGFIKGDKIIINKTVARATGAVNVGNHELLHGVLRKAVKDKDISEKVISELKTEIGSQWSAVEQRASENYTPEYMEANPDEWITLASDAIQNGDITYSESIFERLGNVFTPILRAAGFKQIKFDTGKDVYSFLKEYNKSIHKGALSSGIAKATKGKVSLDETDDLKTSLTSDQKKAAAKNVKALGENQTNKSWRRGGADTAIKDIKDNGYFDALIASKYKVKPVPRDFVEKVYSEITPHIKRFKPEQNDNLFAYINSQIGNKAGNVYNKEYKVDEAMRGSKDIDAKTSEGAPVIQVAAETDTGVKSFEEQDMSMAAQAKRAKLAEQGKSESDKYSGLRTELGLEKPMMDKVRNAVMKTFGTKLPDVNSKKFKAALQKAYRTELKKPIQDMIGKGEVYDAFLAESFPTVFKFLPKETLLQMERNVAPENRIFTKSERITKPTEVDKLISDGLLPKETNRLSGPTLITKLPYPGSRKVMAYFRGQNMENALGYKVGASTLGTRKDKLAMEMGVELGFDATMETVQQPEVADRLQDIEDLQGYKRIENHNSVLAKQIDRDPSIKFSKTLKKGIDSADLSHEQTSDILKNVNPHKIEVDHPSLHDATILEFENKYKPKPFVNIQFLGQVSRGIPSLAGFIKNKGHQTKKTVDGEYVYDVEGLTNHYNKYSMGALDFIPQKIGDREQTVKGNYRFLENGILKGSSDRGNSGHTLDIRTERRDKFRTKVASDMGSNVTPETQKLWDEFYKVEADLELAESTFDGPDTLLREIKSIQRMNIPAAKKVKLAQGELNPKALAAAQKLFTAYNASVQDWVNHQVDTGKMTRDEAIEYVIRDKQKNTNFNKGERAMAAFTSAYFVDGVQDVKSQKGEHVKDSATASAQTVISIYNNTVVQDSPSILKGFEQSLVPKKLADRLDDLGGANSPLGNLRFILDPSIGKNVYDLSSGKSMYNLELERFTANQVKVLNDIHTRPSTKVMDNAIKMSRSSSKPKGITVLDFDDTLATTKSNVIVTPPDPATIPGKRRTKKSKISDEYAVTPGKDKFYKSDSYLDPAPVDPAPAPGSRELKDIIGKDLSVGGTFYAAKPFKLSAEEFAKHGSELLAQGYKFDFSEFNKVVDGKTAPLFNKAMKLSGKFGTENMFILTARAPQSAKAIKQFLDAQGLKIPLKNITGLGKSEASAKANWIAEKVGEGYNDFYFADDAMQNVKAVKDMLDQFDVKGKVQQARLKFSKSGPKKMSDIIDESQLDLNKILEETKGVGKDKRFSAAKARQRGKNKGKFKFFVPPSADDFAGLMYSFMGRGKQGNKHHAWFKKNLFDPFSKGMRRHKMVQQQVANDMKNLRKAMPDVRKKLGKKVPGTEYTHEDAIRIYNWSQAGLDIPGLSQADATALINAIESDPKLQAFAQGVNSISETPGGMVEPGPHWTGGNIALDLKEALDNARGNNLRQWVENKNIIFSEANMNKIEAVYGSNFREALEDSLYRMETGSTQNVGKDRLLNNFTAWIHGSIGTTMFLNARSAMLQMISNVNFVNWSDNNMIKASGAFANQKQYWKDVSMIFNSPFLKQRRSGIQTDVNAAELLAQIKDSKNKAKAATAYLLQLGFTPTQVADSFAIATGGATFYRNRIKTYLKEGMTQTEAETKAFDDMMEIAEETQQSTRADKISQQQASPIGKFILAFQNTPMQYNRLIKKAAQDLVNGRGDVKANLSRIVYYGGIQNLIFYGLQTALFATLFSDDEEDDITNKKTERVVNGMVDTLLRGSGIGGAVVSTVKNVIIKFMKESEKMNDGIYYTDPDWGNVVIEGLNVSPPVGIKARKIYSGLKTWEYNKDVIDHMGKTDIDNPVYDAAASVTEAVTNVPLSRMYNKFQNISEALNSDHDTWKRVAMLLGWSKWSFGIKNQDVVDAKGEAKTIKAAEKKEGNRNTFIDDQKKEISKGKKDITCAASTRSGGRCGKKVIGGGSHCTIHEKVEQRADGEKKQCSHVKANGKRCKMKTTNKSGKCYYHD